MSSWARVGGKAVCIRHGVPTDKRGFLRWPEEGEALTVRGVFVDRHGSLTLRFNEIVNPVIMTQEGMHERTYPVKYFRPLITKSQEDDISMFKSLLKPTEVPA